MMIVLVVLLVAALAIIIWIVARHFKKLRLLNPDSLPEVREEKVKTSILAERFGRVTRDRFRAAARRLEPLRALGSRVRGRFYSRLHTLELSYERAKQLALGTRGKRTAQIVGLIREAEEFERQGKYDEAERKYVAVVSLDPRNVDAYEGLGNLYLRTRKYAEAREALNFILKFRPNDASVLVSLGEVALADGKPTEALPHLNRAVSLRPSNPKYLDFFIETAILVGDRAAARRGLERIHEVNPENAKIVEWERRIADLSKK